MHSLSRTELVFTIGLGIFLAASAAWLVCLHFEARHLFIEHEREVDVHSRLLADQSELEMKVRRASLPANISIGAAMLGMAGATGESTVTLVEGTDGSVDFLPEIRRELDKLNSQHDAQGAQPEARP